MNEDEIKQHDVPLDGMLTETIVRALNRLVRFMTRFVELGNEKNHVSTRIMPNFIKLYYLQRFSKTLQ